MDLVEFLWMIFTLAVTVFVVWFLVVFVRDQRRFRRDIEEIRRETQEIRNRIAKQGRKP